MEGESGQDGDDNHEGDGGGDYRRRADEGGAILDLFSPIPKWARRRLAIIGSEVQPAGCLMSFLVQEAEVGTEEKFLRDLLFLSRTAG